MGPGRDRRATCSWRRSSANGGAGGGGAPTITAPAGWTSIVTGANSGKVTVAMYYIQNCGLKPANTTEAFTTTNSSATTVRLLEFAGIVTVGALDVSGTATGGGAATSSVSSTGAVSTSPELGVAIFAHQIPGTATNEVAASAPYADVGVNLLIGAGSGGVHEDTLYSTAVTGGAVATASVGVSANQHSWAFAIATFQQAPLYWRGGLPGCSSGSSFSLPACWSTSSGGASAGVAPRTQPIARPSTGTPRETASSTRRRPARSRRRRDTRARSPRAPRTSRW